MLELFCNFVPIFLLYPSRSDLFLTELIKTLPDRFIKYEETSERNCSSLVPQYQVFLAKPIIVSIVSNSTASIAAKVPDLTHLSVIQQVNICDEQYASTDHFVVSSRGGPYSIQ